MDTEELNDEQIEQIDALENAAAGLLDIMSEGKHDNDMEDIYSLIEKAQALVEKKGLRAYFPAHIDDGDNSYTIDYTDEELEESKGTECEYVIFQLPSSHPAKFMGTGYMLANRLKLLKEDYVLIYHGSIVVSGALPKTHSPSQLLILNRIFEMLNAHAPSGYHAHSLSVSDMVGIKGQDGKYGYWIVDTFGITPVTFENDPETRYERVVITETWSEMELTDIGEEEEEQE